jgi:hypothetical protein
MRRRWPSADALLDQKSRVDRAFTVVESSKGLESGTSECAAAVSIAGGTWAEGCIRRAEGCIRRAEGCIRREEGCIRREEGCIRGDGGR